MSDPEEDIDRFLYGDDAEAVKQVASSISKPKLKTNDNEASFLANMAANESVRAPRDPTFSLEESTMEVGEQDEEDYDDEIEIFIEDSKEKIEEKKELDNQTIDINVVGKIGGKSIFDFDMEELGSYEDRPWLRPGADITDYFNYGFNEITWRAYSAKQRAIREDPSFTLPKGLAGIAVPSGVAPNPMLMMPFLPPGLPPPPPFLLRPPMVTGGSGSHLTKAPQSRRSDSRDRSSNREVSKDDYKSNRSDSREYREKRFHESDRPPRTSSHHRRESDPHNIEDASSRRRHREKPSETSTDRSIERSEKMTEKSSERYSSKTSDRGGDKRTDRTPDRAPDRSSSKSNDGVLEQGSEKSTQKISSRHSDREYERSESSSDKQRHLDRLQQKELRKLSQLKDDSELTSKRTDHSSEDIGGDADERYSGKRTKSSSPTAAHRDSTRGVRTSSRRRIE